MRETADLRRIHARVQAVALRVRLQRGLEGGATAAVIGLAAALVLVLLFRLRLVGAPELELAGVAILAAIGAGAMLGFAWRLTALETAKRIDQRHGLHDRLGSALEFGRLLRRQPAMATDFMAAQISDACRCLSQVQSRRAAPLRLPRDSGAVAVLAVALSCLALVRFPEKRTAVPPKPSLPRLKLSALDLEPGRSLARELGREAVETRDPELGQLAAQVARLLDDLEQGKLTKQQLFERMAEIEAKPLAAEDGDFSGLLKQLRKAGAELAKQKLARPAGQALAQEDLAKAREELKRLSEEAQRLAQAQGRQQLARGLERGARALDRRSPQEQAAERQQQRRMDELRREQRRLQREQQANPRNPETQRRLQRNQRELERLERDQQRQAEQRRQLQRLSRDLERAAAGLEEKVPEEVARALRELADKLGRIQDEVRRAGAGSRARLQLADLKELLRRLGRNGRQAQQQKLRDFWARAEGKGKQGDKGAEGRKAQALGLGGDGSGGVLVLPGGSRQGGAAEAGERRGPGQGQDSPRGSPGDGIGTSHDPNLMGDPTSLSARRQQTRVETREGAGPTRAEVIRSASERGFATQAYSRVYADYAQVVEETINQEQVPLGYKYYVKRYFQLIKPRQ